MECYSWIDDNNSGYSHITHILGGGDFGFGISSTSHIESLWNALKAKIKTTYHIIRSKNFISFLREAEWKYINRKKNNSEKIKEFFECYDYVKNLNDIVFEPNEFLSDSDIEEDNSSDNSGEDD